MDMNTFFNSLSNIEEVARETAKIEFAKAIRKYGHLDNDNHLYISSGDMCDESLYINGDFDPTYNDDIETEINYVEELGSIGFDKDGKIYVSTDMSVYYIDALGFSDIMLLAEYVSYLEEK